MFSIELKFTADVRVKWFKDVFKSRFNELDEIKKTIRDKCNPLDWPNKKCVICNFKPPVSLNEGHAMDKLTTWYDFTVQK